MDGSILHLAVFSLAFLTEYIGATIGMGYSTIMVPILIILGFDPISSVFAVIVSQLSASMIVSVFNHFHGNADFSINSKDTKIALILGISGILGSILGAIVAVNVSASLLAMYIGLLVMVIGVITLLARKERVFSMRTAILLGMFVSLNKSMTGGGYGPILTGAQIIYGENSKRAVARIALSEIIICAIGAITYIFLNVSFDTLLAMLLVAGASIATPLASRTIRELKERDLKKIISIAMILLGLATFLRGFGV